MSKRAYLPRLCDAELKLALQSSGAVLIEGAKWFGKTSTAGQFTYQRKDGVWVVPKRFCIRIVLKETKNSHIRWNLEDLSN